ncbi:hypothetical protein [Dyadobacter luticola]|uniref:Uncharacterized protein n=1 Tax=Dyadobacter luticola TaxID=1979387 RepID=A0A5R9L0Y9_9BACT|nr:hypothetical protein [Dyadobacter luticola]TLV02204.1 hypothetical protein FEN17_00760 [Dyadobacter luticola]
MRNLYPILLLFLLVTCKKQDDYEPLLKVVEGLPAGITSFMIDEVPKENIRFVNLMQTDQVVVTLPQNYTKGEKLITHFKLAKGIVVLDSFQKESDGSTVELNFDKADVLTLMVYDKKLDAPVGRINIYVDPTTPLTAVSKGKNYEEVLEGELVLVPFTVQNLGTLQTITDKNELSENIGVSVKNKKTGVITGTYANRYNSDHGLELLAVIPPDLEAGEYEVTVQKQNRKVVLPDALVLKYGEPLILNQIVTSTSKDGAKLIRFNGYNLLPERKYTVELKNDFTAPQQLTLFPENQLSIKQTLPASLAGGNYEATLFIDGKEVPSSSSFGGNLLAVKRETGQPILVMVSNKSNVVNGEVTFYKATTTFKKSEPIIAYLRDIERKDMALLFKNVVGGKTYELKFNGTTETMYAFSYFDIPENVPAGKYEVYLRDGNKTSERYHKVVTIE